jgi:hypothetical protein
LAAAILPDFLLAQSSDAKQIVSAAVDAELFADHNDRTAFEYRDHDVTPDHDTVYYIVQYPKGALKRKTEDHGHPLTAQQRQAEDTRIRNFVNDPALQEKARRDSAHDDAQAEEFLKLLPSAFLWTVQSATPASTTLTFRPDPNFSPRSLEARVLGAMSGEMVVMRGSNRIHIIRGTLREDVKFGFGILGRLRAGGTFNVERREIVPGHWQITDSHIHFDGRALFFKNIGEQEDETLTDFKISGAANIDQAAAILENVR